MPDTNEPVATPPAGTSGEQPPAPVATPPSSEPTVTPKTADIPKGYQLVKDEDINKLKSRADKAENNGQQTDAVVSALLQKDAVRDAMREPEFKEKYPDVTEAELLEANPLDEEQIEKFASAKQARYEEVKQAHLKKVQVANAPTITQADKDTQLQELAKPAKTSRFQQAMRLQRTQVK